MGLFSKPSKDSADPALLGKIPNYLLEGKTAPHYVKKIAAVAPVVEQHLAPGETVVSFVTSNAGSMSSPEVVGITSRRIIEANKRRVLKEFLLTELAEVERGAHSQGYFHVMLISRDASPFRAFAGTGQVTPATTTFFERTVTLSLKESFMVDGLEQTISFASQGG